MTAELDVLRDAATRLEHVGIPLPAAPASSNARNLGIGYQLPLGERTALRIEARGYATLVNSSGGMFCSGGCTISIKGDTLTQGNVQLGLSFRY